MGASLWPPRAASIWAAPPKSGKSPRAGTGLRTTGQTSSQAPGQSHLHKRGLVLSYGVQQFLYPAGVGILATLLKARYPYGFTFLVVV